MLTNFKHTWQHGADGAKVHALAAVGHDAEQGHRFGQILGGFRFARTGRTWAVSRGCARCRSSHDDDFGVFIQVQCCQLMEERERCRKTSELVTGWCRSWNCWLWPPDIAPGVLCSSEVWTWNFRYQHTYDYRKEHGQRFAKQIMVCRDK